MHVNWIALAGIVFSLLCTAVTLAYSAGNLGTRVGTLETQLQEIRVHNDARDDVLRRIDTTLARIDERMQIITGVKRGKASD